MSPIDRLLNVYDLYPLAVLRVGSIFLFGIWFISWNWGQTTLAIEYVILAIATEGLETLPDEVNQRISRLILAFGASAGKITIVIFSAWGINKALDAYFIRVVDFSGELALRQRESEQKLKQLEDDISKIDRLSEQAKFIKSLSKDIEILSDRISRLKLEAGRGESARPQHPGNPEVKKIRNPELFAKPNRITRNPPKIPPTPPEF